MGDYLHRDKDNLTKTQGKTQTIYNKERKWETGVTH